MRFIKVKRSFFSLEQTLTMPIFLYDPQREQRKVTLYSNSPITEELIGEWEQAEEKGGHLQIIWEEKESFCDQLELNYIEIEKNNEFLFKMLAKENKRIQLYEDKVESNFHLKSFLVKNLDSNYLPLIQRVHDEVMLFPLGVSDEISMVTELVEKLFVRDLIPVRIAALSYYLAKLNKVTDPESLSSVILAALIKDIGLNQINVSEAMKKQHKEGDLFYKHPMLSVFLMSKTGFEFSTLTKRLVLEHQEVSNGTGYPRGKKEDKIEPLSQLIQAADQYAMLVEGYITGNKMEPSKAIRALAQGTPVKGLVNTYPLSVVDTLKSLIPNEEDLKP